MPEEPRQQRLIIGQRHHAVAEVARRQHVEVTPQPPARSAIVGHGHDGSKIADQSSALGCSSGSLALRRRSIAAQPAQQGGKPGATTDGNHAQ